MSSFILTAILYILFYVCLVNPLLFPLNSLKNNKSIKYTGRKRRPPHFNQLQASIKPFTRHHHRYHRNYLSATSQDDEYEPVGEDEDFFKSLKKAASDKLGSPIPLERQDIVARKSSDEFTKAYEGEKRILDGMKREYGDPDKAVEVYRGKLDDDDDDDVDKSNKSDASPTASTIPPPPLPFAAYLTPPILSIASIYLPQGLLGLTSLARTFLLKDSLHLDPATSSALGGLFVIPWTIKPLYGIISDTFPLFGSRRKSYLILGGLGAALSNLLLSFPALRSTFGEGNEVLFVVACSIVGSGCIALTDVVADGIVVEETRRVEDDLAPPPPPSSIPLTGPNLQSLCWGAAAFGGILSSYSSGSLVDTVGPEGVYRYAAFLPLLVAFVASLIKEDKPALKSPDDPATLTIVKNQLSELKDAFGNEKVWKPALWLFLWQSTPTSEGAFLYFMTNDLSMSAEFLGKVKLVTSVAGLLGVAVYNKWLKEVEIKDVLYWSSLISAPLGLTQLILVNHWNRDLGIPDSLFVFGDDAVLTVLGQIAFMPTLVLAAKLCPVGIEGTLFALLMSTFNLAGIVGSEVGALLTKVLGVTATDFKNLGALTVICNLSSLYPLLFIDKFLASGEESENKDEDRVKVNGEWK